jgi:hypothetical protein
MAQDASDPGRSGRGPTLGDVIARRLAGSMLEWAITPILAMLTIGIAAGLFMAWIVIFVVYAQVMIALGFPMGTSGSGALVLVIGFLVSLIILFRPVRWVVRNLLGAQRRLYATADRLAPPTAVGPSTTVAARHATTTDELRAIDARLAPSPPASAAGQGPGEQPNP